MFHFSFLLLCSVIFVINPCFCSTRRPQPNFPIPSPPPTSNETTCFDYTLENECSSFLDGVLVNTTIQEILFNGISLNVSDIRMVSSDCRRPLLWFSCGLVFPGCPSETLEQQLCRYVEGCYEVNKRCEFYNISFDCLFPPLEDEECSTRISEEIEQATEYGVPVQTCLNKEKETIECCPDPFIVDYEGECVVECPQYWYGERYERAATITLFVLVWIGVLCVIIGQFPLFMMSINTKYPACVLSLALIANIFLGLTLMFSMFDGFEEYFCGNEINFFIALEHFGRSRVAGVQMSFIILFTHLSVSFWVLQSFNTVCFLGRGRWKFLRRFVDDPISIWVKICGLVPCFLIPFSLYLFCVIFFFTHDSPSNKVYLFAAPFGFAAFGINPFNDVFRIYSLICLSFVAVLFFFSLVLILRISYRLAFIQWRGLFVQLYFFIAYGFYLWLLLLNDFGTVVFDNIVCVASHPRIDPPPCQVETDEGKYMNLITYLIIVLFPITISLVVHYTNPLVFGWWKELIFKRKIVRNATELDSVNLSHPSLGEIPNLKGEKKIPES